MLFTSLISLLVTHFNYYYYYYYYYYCKVYWFLTFYM